MRRCLDRRGVVLGVVVIGALMTTAVVRVVRGHDDDVGVDDDALEGPTDADEALVSWFARSPLTNGTLAEGAMYTVIQREYDYDGEVKRRGRQRGLFSTISGDRGVLATVRVSGGMTATRGDWEENGPQRALAEVNYEWALAVMLMRERAKGKASKFAPFVHSLYAHTPASAVVVSAGAREALEAYSAGETIQDADADVKRGWASAKKTFKQFPTIFSNVISSRVRRSRRLWRLCARTRSPSIRRMATALQARRIARSFPWRI